MAKTKHDDSCTILPGDGSAVPCPDPETPDVPRETEGPEPVLSGTFKIYPTPGGGLHLAFRTDQHGEGHKEISPLALKLLSGGKLAKLIKS